MESLIHEVTAVMAWKRGSMQGHCYQQDARAITTARLTIARGTMATRSFWLMKISDTAMSVVPFLGYSTCHVMGCVPERLLKLAISKFICMTSLNRLPLLEGNERKWL